MSKRSTITRAALGLVAACALYRFVIRPRHLRCGATDEEKVGVIGVDVAALVALL